MTAIGDARAAAAAARAQRRDLTMQLAAIDRAIAIAARSGTADQRSRLAEQRKQLVAQLEAARAAEQRTGIAFGRAVATSLQPDIAQDLARLDAANPIVLLPVRLETRYVTAGDGFELRVRIYPDSIAGDTHEPALTDAERRDGEAFWTTAWNPARELAAWRALVARRPAARAAWIADALTPTNLATRPSAAPQFPAVAARSHVWTRPGEARLLPERWLVVAYQGPAEIARAQSAQPVHEPLVLTVAPDEAGVSTVALGQTLHVDDELLWAYDFARAETQGMAVRLPVPRAAAAAAGIDLYCVGVKTTLDAADGPTALGDLLDAHRYSRGLALVAQGTPTNNTSADRAPDLEAEAAASFAIARGTALATEDSDGEHLADTLGVARARFDHVEGAAGGEQRRARAMNNALWPATLGYYLDQMMAPVFEASDIRWARQWFVSHVRGRGPAPALRIGGMPYGVLPVTSLAHWPADSSLDATPRALPAALKRLRPFWSSAISRVPAVRPSSATSADPDADLAAVLAMDASARELWIRHAVGKDAMWSLAELFTFPAGWEAPQRRIATDVLAALGHPEWDPRVMTMVFDGDAKRFIAPLVADQVGDQPLAFDYIAWLGTSGWVQRLLRALGTAAEPTALLYRMLSYAVHREVDAHAFEFLVKHNRVAATDRREPELVGILPGTEKRLTMAQRLTASIPEVSGARSLGEYLWAPGVLRKLAGVPTVRESLADLERVATVELERLFTETLDCCSHRLDAWITSLATARLGELRARQAASYIGAFGWVEGLRPRELSPDLPPNLGFVHAPSMDHATAAAILRNAWGSTTGDTRQRYAVDLSSRRVRVAADLLAAVREGQPIAAVLGYRFERALHDARLDLYKEPFRLLYPLRLDRRDTSTGPIDAIAARDVVDGLTLRQAYRAGSIPWARLAVDGQPAPQAALSVILSQLDELVDAAADLLLSEAVFQLVRGNAAGAQATFEAVAGGAAPPDPEIIRQPRGGTPLTHRVGVVVGTPAASAGWPSAGALRSRVEPYLDGWLAGRLGRADRAVLDLSWPEPQTSGPPITRTRRIDVGALGLRSLDLVAVLHSETAAGQDSELDRRAIAATRAAGAPRPPEGSSVTITYAPALTDAQRATHRTAAELFDVVRAWRDVLAHIRPLVPTDLAPPAEASSASSAADLLAAELASRVQQATAALASTLAAVQAAVASADPAALRSALRASADLGIAGAYPSSSAGADDRLLPQTAAALGELTRRHDAVAGLPTTATAQDVVTAVLGSGAAILPRFVPHRSELDAAFAAGPAIGATAAVVQRWQQQAARVHAGLGRWRTAELLAEVHGAPAARFDVAQLPHAPGARWVALPFTDESQRPLPGRISLVLHRAATPVAAEPWCGFWLDEWAEIIPNRRETTGVAFHHDAPNAEAPQAILVAVAPPSIERWSAPVLLDTLRETLELAKLRGVDAERLAMLGQLLPTTFFATNRDDEALRFDLIPHLVLPVLSGGSR